MLVTGDTILEGYDDIDFTDSGEFKGPRDVLILVSRQDGLGSPRKQGQFFLEDVAKLRSEKIPEEHWNDEAKILEDRFKREKEMFKRKRKIDVVVQVESKPNTTVGHAIDCITNLMEARNYEDRMKESKFTLLKSDFVIHVLKVVVYFFLFFKNKI